MTLRLPNERSQGVFPIIAFWVLITIVISTPIVAAALCMKDDPPVADEQPQAEQAARIEFDDEHRQLRLYEPGKPVQCLVVLPVECP